MLFRLLKADLARSKAVTGTLCALIALATMLLSAATALIVDTVSASNRLSERAKLPDLIQMHTGEIDAQAIKDWAAIRPEVVAVDVLTTIPAPRHLLWIAEVNQANSYHEPAFVTSPHVIDLLLDEAGQPVAPKPGQISLPIHYLVTGQAAVGDVVRLDLGHQTAVELRIVGFHRDAQMNAAMVPSKRLVVHADDFAQIAQAVSEREYLIEFAVTPGASTSELSSAYAAADLPASGIVIGSAMLSLMNALATMLIPAVAIIVAATLALVAMLALRYTVLAAAEMDMPQIAVLKAIGAPHGGISRLYLAKYAVLTAVGATVGYALGMPAAAALGGPTLVYLGSAPTTVAGIALPILGAGVLAGFVLASAWLSLRRLGRLSCVEAMRGGVHRRASGTSVWGRLLPLRALAPRLVRSRALPAYQWMGIHTALQSRNVLLIAMLALCTFTMMLPTAVAATLNNPQIGTFLGSGQADLRVDIRTGTGTLEEVEQALVADARIALTTTILRRSYTMETADGSSEAVLVDIGDHSAFPQRYLEGGAPEGIGEVALSYLQHQSTGARIGDTVTLVGPAGMRQLTVTGIYQDITNNGHTAKATFDDASTPLWQLIYANVSPGANADDVAAELSGIAPSVQVTTTSTYASTFFGAINTQIVPIAFMSCAIALALAFLLSALFAVLVLARERAQIAAMRAIGSAPRQIATQYLTWFALIAVIGIALGWLATGTLGQGVIAALLASRGAPDVQLLPLWWLNSVLLPLTIAATVLGAVGVALRNLPPLSLSETA